MKERQKYSKTSVVSLAKRKRTLPLYLLPISVFGFSVATAELTEMSRRSDQASVVAGRVQLGLRKVSLAAGLSAAVLFFGVVAPGAEIQRIELRNAGDPGDGFGYDDLIVGRVRRLLS